MKHKLILFITLLTLFSSKVLKAQDETYIPVLSDSIEVFELNVIEWGVGLNQWGVSYTEIYNDTIYYRLSNEGYLIMEDTTERKIYRCGTFSNGTFYRGELLYDFSLNEGDSIFIQAGFDHWYYVDSIRYINTYAGLRKAWYFHSNWDSHGEEFIYPVWVEGIGSLAGFMQYHVTPSICCWGWGLLGCWYSGDSLVYKSELAEQYDCDFHDLFISVEEPIESNFKLYPNPLSENSAIEFNNLNSEQYTLSVFDIIGRVVYKTETKGNKFELKKSDFKSGIYIYNISDSKQIIYSNKFIVQ